MHQIFLALLKESTRCCSNVAKGCNVCPTPRTAVRILSLWLLFYFNITNGELLIWCLKLDHPACPFQLLLFCVLVPLASPARAQVHLRCWRCYWLCALLENWVDHRDPWHFSHLVRGDYLIYGDKISISWTVAKCQSCLLSSKSQPSHSSIGLWLSM